VARGYGAALARAKSEKKVLLVHVRSSCGICNRSMEKALAEAETHAPITALYESFVRVRVNEGVFAAAPSPSMLIVDPGGTIVLSFRRVDDANQYLHLLTGAVAQTPNIVQLSRRSPRRRARSCRSSTPRWPRSRPRRA
jgi:hypothetical protein